MTTKPPAEINYSEPEKLVRKIYTAIDELENIIPLPNDRNRLSFCINMYFNNEIETVLNAIYQAQPRSSTVKYDELEKMVVKKFKDKGIVK